jgi:hypothetical protein
MPQQVSKALVYMASLRIRTRAGWRLDFAAQALVLAPHLFQHGHEHVAFFQSVEPARAAAVVHAANLNQWWVLRDTF